MTEQANDDILVEYCYHSGTDLDIVNAARVSMDKYHYEFDEVSDTRLLEYLSSHGHWTPFSHTSITLRVTAPIVVRTHCFKHKVGLTENEVSRRYVTKAPKIYNPTFRYRPEGNIKQGSGGLHHDQDALSAIYTDAWQKCQAAYNALLEHGVAPEQARFILPQGVLTQWMWTGSLYAYANFCRKRSSSDAQSETRQVAKQVSDILQYLYPIAWDKLTGGEL